MSQTNFQKVGEFHKHFGHPSQTEPQYDIFEKNPKVVEFRQSLIDEEFEEFKDGCKQKDFIEVADALADMLVVIYGTGHAFGINLDKVFSEVHRSNMTKLCKSQDEAQRTVDWYKQNESRYKDPKYRIQGDYWVVYDAATTKILKSINFELPNIKKVLDEQI